MSENAATPTFLDQVNLVIGQNLKDERFGVSELAEAMNMSRSNLLRKVKKETKLSVSQLISQARLKRAMELLRKSSLNVSEVAGQVGFSSTSYFIKCFREYYGYPPGEVGKREEAEPTMPVQSPAKTNYYWIFGGIAVVAALIWAAVAFFTAPKSSIEKSIAVLPFKNESTDSSNVYLINGLMESTLNSLQKIKDLRVVSRTSSEKYRTLRKSVPEMARELNVNYFVEGSGQKIGDNIVLHIQLIDAVNDRHVWSRQYRRETKDLFRLQEEVAKNIADEVKAIITPEEQRRIGHMPTNDLQAYDLYLKGKNLIAQGGKSNHLLGIEHFRKAIDLDPEFALAYAEIAIAYYYVDLFQTEKTYTGEITINADRAMLYDPKLGESLVAKALDYMIKKEYSNAVPYLEKALEYNPNSAAVVGFLSDFYANYMPDTGKYLEYALKGVQLDIAAQDSVTASYTYLRLGNALIQTGFVDEALKNMDKSLDYNPRNPWSRYVRAFALYAKNGDIKQTRSILIDEYNKDTTRFDILQDIAKVTYYMRDYKGAYHYYKKFLAYRESAQLDVYRHENLGIGIVLNKAGLKEKSEILINDYRKFLDEDKSIYKTLGLAAYYNYRGDQTRAMDYLKAFSKEENVQYWVILFMEFDPVFDSIKDSSAFKEQMSTIKARFWKTHQQLKLKLEDEGLL